MVCDFVVNVICHMMAYWGKEEPNKEMLCPKMRARKLRFHVFGGPIIIQVFK